MKLESDKITALIGPSGNGKTTLTYLLCRFYEPENGSISIDGTNIQNIDIHTLRNSIGLASADLGIFPGTILDNLNFGAPDSHFDKVKEICRDVGIDEFISSLPNGYYSNINLDGTGLSNGQKQRIILVRALLRNPKILILDEATSGLDSESEATVLNAILDKYKANRIILIITHRLNSARLSDHICFMEKGEMIEQGTFKQLITQNGRFSTFYKLQMES